MMGCGWVAVRQIWHSSGTLYGLSLALFDGLFFPLLVVDGLVCLMVGEIMVTITGPDYHSGASATAAVVSLLICVVLDFFIVRKVWRICRR